MDGIKNNPIISAIFEYVEREYGTIPDYPWDSEPNYAVLRHADNKKWYGLVFNAPSSKLGLGGVGMTDILNIKCDPILSGSLRLEKGFRPGYHMNHESWLTILLDGTVEAERIFPLLDMSYELTAKRKKKK